MDSSAVSIVFARLSKTGGFGMTAIFVDISPGLSSRKRWSQSTSFDRFAALPRATGCAAAPFRAELSLNGVQTGDHASATPGYRDQGCVEVLWRRKFSVARHYAWGRKRRVPCV